MVTRKDIKNKYNIFRSTSKILVILLILGFSQTAPAQQWERVVGEAGPGVRITDEHPVCWFSSSHESPVFDIQFEPDPGMVTVVHTYGYDSKGRVNEISLEISTDSQWLATIVFTNIQYDSLGRIIEYYANITSGEYYVETHVYDMTHDIHGRITGFKELRHYHTSGNAYNIIISDAKYDGFGKVKDGYPVTVNQNSLPIPPKNISDYINNIYIWQLWDYGDPTDGNDLTYEFYLEISSFSSNFGDWAINTNTSVESVEFLTPTGNTFKIPKLPNQWSNGILTSYEYSIDDWEWEGATWEYRARFSDLADLQAYGDGKYTIILNHTDGSKSQTTAWFGIPDTNDTIPQPTQEPVLISPLHNQTLESPVTFSWEPCIDPNVDDIFIGLYELGTDGDKWGDFDINETSWEPVYLPDGIWEAWIYFDSEWCSTVNDEGIYTVARKSSKNLCRFKSEGYPWTTYEVWGGKKEISWIEGSYGNILDLEKNGYVKLGKSDGQTETFSGQYDYYLIATVGEFLLDSIEGSDGSYYPSFGSNDIIFQMYDPNNLLGPPDGKCAIVGVDNAWDDYSGYFVFTNPGNWKELTVTTCDINLNLSKSVVGTVEEIENINPNDNITYRICFDSNDFTQDVTDITVVDILPDEVTFVSTDSNGVSGTYDPDKHTYTWSYPSLAPESEIETQLTVQVKPDVTPGTTIINFVTISSNETPPYTTSMNVLVSEIRQVEVENLSITPNVLRRNGTSQYITAVVQFPEGTNQNDIDLNDQPELYHQDRSTGEFALVGKGSAPVLSGTAGRPQISISFNRAELMNALQGYGEFKLKVQGKLTTGQYNGEAIIYVTRFVGD